MQMVYQSGKMALERAAKATDDEKAIKAYDRLFKKRRNPPGKMKAFITRQSVMRLSASLPKPTKGIRRI